MNFEVESMLHSVMGDTRSNDNEMVILALNCYNQLFEADECFLRQFEKMDALTTMENL